MSAFVLIHAFTLSASKYIAYASDLERQHQLRVSQHSHCPLSRRPAREELKFRLLRAKDLSPVNYKRVAEKDGKEVPWDEIVKGYEYEKGKYIVLKDEDFQRVDLEATQTVDIQDFVDQEEIDPMFFYKPYYLEPQKGGDKAYVLLRETLQKTGKVGIAKVVIKTRQYLAGVKAKDSVLVLELMHFAEELAEQTSSISRRSSSRENASSIWQKRSSTACRRNGTRKNIAMITAKP